MEVHLENRILRSVVAVIAAFFISSCASSRKDVYLRTRLPNIETPDLGVEDSFGLSADVETSRFTVKTTNNLTNSFYFVENSASYGDPSTVAGLDLAATYSNLLKIIPFQLAVTFDFVELKFGLLDFRHENSTGWLAVANYGYYKTAAFMDDASCSPICFSSQADQDAAKRQQDQISTEQKGDEQKIGITVANYYKPDWAVFMGYDWYDAHLAANAYDKVHDRRIYYRQNLYGSGYGIGFLHLYEKTGSTIAAILQNVLMDYHGDPYRTTILTVSGHLSF